MPGDQPLGFGALEVIHFRLKRMLGGYSFKGLVVFGQCSNRASKSLLHTIPLRYYSSFHFFIIPIYSLYAQSETHILS